MELTAHRDRIYSWLRRCLIGNGEDLTGIKPLERYQTGILFPVVRGEFGLDPAASDVDDGGGMSTETVERLFDPVFAPDLPSGGLGIGLPACYEIVRKHGGELEVKSEEGHGTDFTI